MDSMFSKWLSAWIKFEKNVTLYPEGHLAVAAAAQELMQETQPLLEAQSQIVLGCFQGRLHINEESFGAEHRQAKALCSYFTQKGIVALTLEFGVTESALERLVRVLQSMQPKRYLIQQPELLAEIQQLPGPLVSCLDLSEAQFGMGVGSLEAYPELQGLLVGYSDTEAELLLGEAETLLQTLKDELSINTAQKPITNEAIVQFLETTVKSGDISPALVKLMAALSRVEADTSGPGSIAPQGVAMTTGHVEKLLERERYEAYVGEDYKKNLQQLSSGITDGGEQVTSSPMQALMASEDFNARVLDAFTDMVLTGVADGITQETAKTVVVLLDEALRSGDYRALVAVDQKLAKRFQHHLEYLRDPLLGQLEQFFRQQSTASKLAEDFERSSGTQADLVSLLRQRYSVHAPWMLEAYCQHCDATYGEALARLLLDKPVELCNLVTKQLERQDISTEPLYRLLHHISGAIGDAQIAGLLEALKAQVPHYWLSKRQFALAMSAVEIILEWPKSPEAVAFLERLARHRLSFSPRRHGALKKMARAGLKQQANGNER